MTDNHCWYKLNLNVKNALRPSWKFPRHNGKYGIWHYEAVEMFDIGWLYDTHDKGISLINAMLFFRGPGYNNNTAHMDLAENKKNGLQVWNFGINWCIGGRDSEMVWYNTPTDFNLHKDVPYTAAKTPFISWPINELTEIERHNIGNTVTLVNTGIPHTVNMNNDPRWCISVRGFFRDNITWDEIVSEMRTNKLLIERV
jgi:hypothetical protein